MRFPLVQKTDDSEMSALYQEMVDYGFGTAYPINWFTSQAIRPDIMKATWELTKGILAKGELPATVKQMIAMTISRQNSCRYCEVTHTGVLESMGVPKAYIESCASDPDFEEIESPHREILKFAVKAASAPNAITDEDYNILRQAGVTDGEILEVSMMAAFTNFINTWADVSGIPVDQEGA